MKTVDNFISISFSFFNEAEFENGFEMLTNEKRKKDINMFITEKSTKWKLKEKIESLKTKIRKWKKVWKLESFPSILFIFT